MNLIEQLGGYAEAKAEWEREGAYPSPNYFYYRELGFSLLQYRREHGIFEVGDYVVLINGYTDAVHYLSGWYIDGLDFRYTTKPNGWGVIVKSSMANHWRHATDAEIKANRRSDVDVLEEKDFHPCSKILEK